MPRKINATLIINPIQHLWPMNKENVRLIVSLTTALTILVLCGGCGISTPFTNEKYTEQLDWTVDSAGISIIDAQAVNGSISFDGSDPGQVVVHAVKEVSAPNEADAEAFARQVQVYLERNGNVLRIYKEHPKPPRNIQVSMRYEIQSPSTMDVKFRTSNGAIQMHGIDGTVDAETSNGAIELQGGKGTVVLRTSNGGISLQAASGRVHAYTSNGGINALVEGLEHEGVFSTSNGGIDVTIRSGVAPVTATTSNGPLEVTLPADFSGRLDAETSNGQVSSEFPILASEKSKNRLVGQIGAGGAAMVKLRTSNGNISLKRQ
jgi:hypothetical protein